MEAPAWPRRPEQSGIGLLQEEGYDQGDRAAAWARAQEWGEHIPIGIVYRGDPVPTYEAQVPALKDGPLVTRPLVKLRPQDGAGLLAEVT